MKPLASMMECICGHVLRDHRDVGDGECTGELHGPQPCSCRGFESVTQRHLDRLVVAALWLDDAAASWFSSEYADHPKRKALRKALNVAMEITRE